MKLKKGFSLAEVLLVLGIISVVTTMGMTISSHGISKAYNLYFYNGFSSMYDAIVDVSMHGQNIDNNFTDFVTEVSNLFESNNLNVAATTCTFTAKNGIQYGIRQYETYTNPDTGTSGNNVYRIEMTVPVNKKRIAEPNKAEMLYFPTLRNGEVYPACVTNGNDYVCLATRTDLLPYYIDTGFNGRNRSANYIEPPKIEGEGEEEEENKLQDIPLYTKRHYDSFANTYGRINGYENINTSGHANGILTIINNNVKQNGVLKFANPNKVF